MGLLLAALVLFAGAMAAAGNPAFAQEPAMSCAPAVGRIVAIQGNVELQRAGSTAWVPVRRLDTAICAGDRVRTDALSRSLLFVQPESFVRLDQNTTLTVNLTTDEIEVQFFASELAEALRSAHSSGAGYFITRFPKKFKVTTPHMNAAVEGTEFMVETTRDATKLTVIEGKVSSESVATRDAQLVTAGQSLESGATGPAAITAVVRPLDAVQWVLRYPPISDGSNASRAEEFLRAGSVDEALTEIDSVLGGDPGNSDALALRAIIQVAKNDKAGALESVGKATVADAGNYRAWLAMSYAQQAGFDLDAALESALKAEALRSGSALAHARVAELHLSLGNSRRAEEAARASIESDPREGHAHTILGFVHLSQIEIQAARQDFTTAIERDSFSALPRLGLGLAKIREGELVAGREEIEIAVALDPGNSLLRSYAGKAYYEENSSARDALASEQFKLARALDPNDPTPWFYESLLKDSQSRPAEALRDLERSTVLNEGRAVYRSRQLLDEDFAARGASHATVYNELGFHQLGVTKAAHSLAVDPASGSAHRFLADIYGTLPRHEIARASELLQAQLRQPLGAPSLQTQLANDVAFRNAFFGPTSVGLNEFNPLFLSDGLNFQFFGLVGNHDTYGDQAILSVLHGPVSFSLSQFASDTDGVRQNNDESLRQYDAFLQWQAGARTSMQVELTRSTRDFGDLQSAFNPDLLSEVIRNEEDLDTQRLGIRHVVDSRSDVVLSVIRQDRHDSIDFPDPIFPVTLIADQESWKSEIQYITSRGNFDAVFGASYFDGDGLEVLILPPDEIPTPSPSRHMNVYGYVLLPLNDDRLQLQLGASYDDLSSDVGEQSEVNPKFGLIWKAADSLTIRAAAFQVLKRRINSDQGLEPTQLAGFNQLFDDRNGAKSRGGGLAADFRITPHLAAGLELGRRDLTVPYDIFGTVFFQSQREDVASAYLYWNPSEQVTVSLEPRYYDFTHGAAFSSLDLKEIPIAVRFTSPSGWRFGVSLTGVEEEGVFTGPGGIDEAGSDSFWLLDAILAYRLPRRLGTLSLEGTNLLDEEFNFQDIGEAIVPRYIPETRVNLRFSFNF